MTKREVKRQEVIPNPPPQGTKAVESDATPVKSGRSKMHKFTPRLQDQETPHTIHIEFLRIKFLKINTMTTAYLGRHKANLIGGEKQPRNKTTKKLRL